MESKETWKSATGKHHMTGKIFGVGVGPGDPELITLKALKVLNKADLIVYPAPEDGTSLARSIAAEHFPIGCKELVIKTPMVSERFPAFEVYDKASAKISDAVRDGKIVVVLCEGDPFFYGSFMYLFSRLKSEHPVEVIPGVSSLTACSASLESPLASRNDVLVILPAPLDDSELEEKIKTADSIAIIKIGRHFERIKELLKRIRLIQNAQYIERATMQSQKIIDIEKVDAKSTPYFSMILIHSRKKAWL